MSGRSPTFPHIIHSSYHMGRIHLGIHGIVAFGFITTANTELTTKTMPPPSETKDKASVVESWWSWFNGKQDEQRLERLYYCRQLEAVLAECESHSSAMAAATKKPAARTGWFRRSSKQDEELSEASPSYNPIKMEEFPAGLRMMKYFDWRHVLTNPNTATTTTSEEEEDWKQPIIRSCARERHSVWACRSVAVGCGKDLAAIKKCFDANGPRPVLTEARTAYEGVTDVELVKSLPCGGLQVKLGLCVHQGARELLERKEKAQ